MIAALFLAGCSSNAQSTDATAISRGDQIEVLDFHTDHRCQTCLTIERLTKAVLQDSFAEQMASGTITFRLINVDEEENFPLAQKFGAFGTSLIINTIQDGEAHFIDLTDFAFMTATNESKFSQELREKIQSELSNLQRS